MSGSGQVGMLYTAWTNFEVKFLRYGKFWAPWRLTGPPLHRDAYTYNIDLGKDENGEEGIASVSGIYRSPDKDKDTNMAGWIENLTLVTTWNKQHGPYGDELTPLMRTNR